jgi:hypothetical protein
MEVYEGPRQAEPSELLTIPVKGESSGQPAKRQGGFQTWIQCGAPDSRTRLPMSLRLLVARSSIRLGATVSHQQRPRQMPGRGLLLDPVEDVVDGRTPYGD